MNQSPLTRSRRCRPWCRPSRRPSRRLEPSPRALGAAWRAALGVAAGALLALGCTGDERAADAALPASSAEIGDRGDSWRTARAAGRAAVRVLYVPSPGFAYRDTAGELTGVTVEIMRAFAAHIAAEHDVALALDFVEEPDWSTFYARVRDASGGVFGLGNVTITESRRRELRFSPSYMTNIAVLITHAIVPELQSLDDIPVAFEGMRPLAFTGTLHEARLRALRDAYLPDTPLAEAGSNAEIIDRVASEPDYFAYIDVYNYWRAREHGEPLRHHAIADAGGEEFGIIMPLGSDWGEVLADYFTRDGGLRESRFYRELLVRHLGAGLAAQLQAGT